MTQTIVDCVVVGCGKMGLLHGALANREPRLRVSGIIDPSIQSRFVAKGIGITSPVYKSIDNAIRGKKNGIAIICTPPITHFSVARKFLENNWGVFVEKPLTMNKDKSGELVDLAQNKNLYNQVGYQLRFNPVFRRLRTLIKENGEWNKDQIQTLEIEILSPQFSRVENSDLGLARGGVEWDLLPHVIDLAIFLLEICDEEDIKIINVERNHWKSVSSSIDFRKNTRIEVTANWASESVRKVETVGRMRMRNGMELTFDLDKIWVEEESNILFHKRKEENPYFEVADQEYSFQLKYLAESVSGTNNFAADFESSWLVDRIIEGMAL